MLTGRQLLLLISFCYVVRRSSQLFRFCHRGVWHQLLEGDCPYGLLFNEQLQTPCYYTKGKVSDNIIAPRIWPSLCDESYLNKAENVSNTTKGDGLYLIRENGQIRMIEFDGVEYDDMRKPSKYNDLISLQACNDRCYRNVFEDPVSSPLFPSSSSHESSDSLEAPNHITRPKLSSNDLAAVRDQTLRLGDYLFDQIESPDPSPGPKLRIVELFKRSIKIMGKTCQHPFIPSNFLNRVLYGFLFLVSDSGVGDVEDLSVEEFEEIMMAFNGCDEKSPSFRLEGEICESNAIVKEVIKILPNGTEYFAPFRMTQHGKRTSSVEIDTNMINPDYGGEGDGKFQSSSDGRRMGSFPYDELDVFIEAAWSAVQVTHATCFATFTQNANMHHRYVSSMEQLFSGKIKDRWRNPTRLIDNEMWGTWFLADVDLTFTNLQACVRAAYLDAPFVMRLDRPIDPVRSSPSFPRDGGGGGGNGGVSFPPSMDNAGFQGGNMERMEKVRRRKRQASREPQPQQPDSYWDTYEASGGIRYKLSEEIQCFQTPDSRDKAVGLLKDQCKTGSK